MRNEKRGKGVKNDNQPTSANTTKQKRFESDISIHHVMGNFLPSIRGLEEKILFF